jgi:hypothetical protein
MHREWMSSRMLMAISDWKTDMLSRGKVPKI